MSARRWDLPPLPPPRRMWRLGNVLALYRVRLRHRWLQELLAVAGIAAGVALLYASQVANTSLAGPVRQLTHGIVGDSRLQLVARGDDGFPAGLARTVQALPGVRRAAPILQVQANLVGPRGRRSVAIFGADPRIVQLRGSLLQGFTTADAARQRTLVLPTPIGRALGVRFGDHARLEVDGRTRSAAVAVVGRGDIGPLVDSAVALAPLAYLQRVTGLPDRISRILVEPEPGQDATVRRGLQRLATDRLDVRPADYEAQLFDTAAQPTSQATTISSVVSALVGFLFAFCAMLVTVGSRRALAIDLRLDGYRPSQVIRILLFDALALGVVAVVLGLTLGELLSRRGVTSDVSYLGGAFPLGDERIVTWSSVAIAAGGGLLAAGLGVLAPLRPIIFARVPQREPGPAAARSRRAGAILPGAGLAGLAAAVAITLLAPGAALVGLIALGVSLVLLLPSLLMAVVGAIAWIGGRRDRAVVALELALPQLRAPEWRARSLAIATTGAIAVFGAVALQGARSNLQAGLDGVSRELNDVTDVWVSPYGAGGVLATTPFAPAETSTLSRVDGVSSVALYRGGFLDIAGRRVWVVGPPAAGRLVPPGQVLDGDARRADARVRAGGWATLSRAVADDLRLHVGERFTLPASQPRTLRVAAITTNLGWSSGAMILNAYDYARAWRSDAVGAYQLRLAPGVPAAVGAARVAAALPRGSSLRVETAAQRRSRWDAVSRSGLSRLRQIAALALVVAVLAMAAAMAGLLWQRRPEVARQKLDGHRTTVMWRALVIESGTLIGTGCLAGALFALLGQILFSRGLETISGFPVDVSVRAGVAALSLALVTAAALLVVALPGYLVARVRPSLRTGD